jgi:hypothetical protein
MVAMAVTDNSSDYNAAATEQSQEPALYPTQSPEPTQTEQLTQTSEPTQSDQATQTPEPTQTEPVTQSPEPTQAEITPTSEPVPTEIEVSPTPTAPPVVTPDPTVTPTPTIPPSPTPTEIPVFHSKTLKLMSSYDYIKNSVTGISKSKKNLTTLRSLMKNYGTLYGNGMPYEEYKAAMEYKWIDATEYSKKPVKLSVDIKNTMNYAAYVDIIKKLSRIDGVFLYKIGKSTEGRDIYAIEIDVPSNYSKNVIMLTGQIHAREFAGGTFLVKQIVELVQKAQTDKSTMELLKRNKFVAVPIINVDGREAIINSPTKWTVRNGGLWKAYTNGTDGGRNFPGLQWGQVIKGTKYKTTISQKSGYANYPGPYAGSNKETKALMKFLYHYVVVEKADIYLDLHSQGSIIYAGKNWQTNAGMQQSRDLRTNVMNILNKGNTKRKYIRIYESSLYGLQGEGSSLTDYATSLAVGARFSPAYGFATFVSGGKEYPLMQVKDLDTSKVRFKEANSNFAALTIEIGYGNSYLGNSSYSRSLLANEYKNYNYGKLLEALPKMIKK